MNIGEILQELSELGIQQNELADAIGMNRSSLNRLLKGHRSLKVDESTKIEVFFQKRRGLTLQKTPQDPYASVVIGEINTRAFNQTLSNHGNIDKQDIRTLLAETNYCGRWAISALFCQRIVGSEYSSLRLLEVLSDNTAPDLKMNDYAIIDLSQTTPSPPGLFCICDGFAISFAKIRVVPSQTPTEIAILDTRSNSTHHTSSISSITILGRVCGNLSVK